MSYGQYRLSETLKNIVCGSGNWDDDVLAIGQVKEYVPVDDTSVAFDTFLNRQEVRVIDGVAPRLVPRAGRHVSSSAPG